MNVKNRRILITIIILVFIIIVGGIFAFSHSGNKSKVSSKIVKIGLMPGGKQEDVIWKQVKKEC